jgi:hypothetical protein
MLLLATVAAGTALAGPPAVPLVTCPDLTGSPWFMPGGAKHGNVYVVTAAKGFGCTRAARLVRGLIGETIHLSVGVGVVLPGAPSGDSCSGLPDAHNHAYDGDCVRGVSYTPGGTVAGPVLFSWAPKGLKHPPAKVDTNPSSTVITVVGVA